MRGDAGGMQGGYRGDTGMGGGKLRVSVEASGVRQVVEDGGKLKFC